MKNFLLSIIVVISSWFGIHNQIPPSQTSSAEPTTTQSVSVQTTSVSDTPSVIAPVQIPTGWQQYSNVQYGISFAYPSNWIISVDSTGSLVTVTASAPRQNINAQYGNALVDSNWKISVEKQCDGQTCTSSTAQRNIVFDNSTAYNVTIDSTVNGRFVQITELWSVNGNADAVGSTVKSQASTVLEKITSTANVK